MKTSFPILTLATLMLVASAANGQTVPLVDRPLVLTEGVGELGLDIAVGLNAGNAGKTVGLFSGLFGDRHGGVSVAYGFQKGIEAGLSVPYVNVDYNRDHITTYNAAMKGWPLLRNTATNHHFGPVEVWGRFRLADFIAAELAVLIPIERTQYNRAAGRLSLPMKYAIIPGLLSIHAQPDLVVGFGQSDVSLNSEVQVSFFVDAGLTLNVLPSLALDLSFGYGRMLKPSPDALNTYLPANASSYLPVALAIDYTVIPSIDLILGFSLDNLTPGSGQGAADSRTLTMGIQYRF